MHGGEGGDGVRAGAGAARGPDQLGVGQVELHPGVPEGEQPLEGCGARAERWRALDDQALPLGLGAVEQRGHQALAAVEAPEDGALADASLGGDGVHGHAVDAVPLDQPGRRREQRLAVARGVAPLPRRLVEQGERVEHALTLVVTRALASIGNRSGPRSVLMARTSRSPRGVPMSDTRVVVLLGSLRADSLNRRIAETLRDQAPAGTVVEIAEGLGEIPFYNEELDGGPDGAVPAAAQRLRDQVAGADRVLAVTPEYNGTMPAVLNNAIDWLSPPVRPGRPRAASRSRPSAPPPRRTAASGRTTTPAAPPASPGPSCWATWSSPSRPSSGDILADPEVVGRLLGAFDAPGPSRDRPRLSLPRRPEAWWAGGHERAHAVHLRRRRPRRHRLVRRGAGRRGRLRADRDGRRAGRPL